MAHEMIVVSAGDGAEVAPDRVPAHHSTGVHCRADATVPLSGRGIEQAMTAGLKLAPILRQAAEATYWAPPHLRSLQTARIAASMLGSEAAINVDGRLSPVPVPEGLSEAELYSQHLRNAHASCGLGIRDVGESMRLFLEAVVRHPLRRPAVLFLPAGAVDLVQALHRRAGRVDTSIRVVTC